MKLTPKIVSGRLTKILGGLLAALRYLEIAITPARNAGLKVIGAKAVRLTVLIKHRAEPVECQLLDWMSIIAGTSQAASLGSI